MGVSEREGAVPPHRFPTGHCRSLGRARGHQRVPTQVTRSVVASVRWSHRCHFRSSIKTTPL